MTKAYGNPRFCLRLAPQVRAVLEAAAAKDGLKLSTWLKRIGQQRAEETQGKG